MARPSGDNADVEVDTTKEVGGEGGSPGDVDLGFEHGPGTGSEADETWKPTDEKVEPIRRDETGAGRRTP